MGACMSMRLRLRSRSRSSQLHRSSEGNSTAKVISLNGSLREYAAPVGVGQVLGAEKERAAAAAAALLMCNSDSLYFDETIPAMDSQDELRPNQMYFVLSASKKEKPLSAADMASLAVKATKAIITQTQSQSNNNKKKKNSGRHSSSVSPLINININDDTHYHHPQEYHHELTVGVNITRKRSRENNNNKYRNSSSSSSTSTATRAKKKLLMPITLRLSTIYESSSSS